jgi:hypothetical protein
MRETSRNRKCDAISDGGIPDAGDGGPVLVWLDQSGQDNNAIGVGSPAIDSTALNGHPAVHFNGTTDYLLVADKPSLQWGTGDFTLAVVVQHTTPNDAGTKYGAFYSKQDPGDYPYYAANASAVGYPARIGGTPAGQDIKGEIAEIIAVEGPLSDADIQQLESYLKTKYGL